MLGRGEPTDAGQVNVQRRGRVVGPNFLIGWQPANAVIVTNHDLEAAPAVVQRCHELSAPGRRHRIFAIVTEGRNLAARDIGRRVRGQRPGIDRDGEARLLNEPGGREAHDTGTDDRDRTLMPGQAKQCGQSGRAPAERDPGAPVPVIVDQPLAAHRLFANDEARGAIGTKARNRSNQAILCNIHSGQASRTRPCPAGGRRAPG